MKGELPWFVVTRYFVAGANQRGLPILLCCEEQARQAAPTELVVRSAQCIYPI